jgi:hypothetical protein
LKQPRLDLDEIARGRTLLDLKREDEAERESFYSRDSKSGLKKELRRGAEFVGWFAAFALAAFLFLSIPFVAQALAGLAAAQSSVFLSIAGVQNSITWVKEVPHIIGGSSNASFDAEIGELCWGKIEFCVLLGVIAASFDRTRRQRLLGFVAGFAFFALAFNPLRIALSLLSQNAVVHDVLFRVTLVAAIAFYYFVWYGLTARASRRARFF